MISFFKDLFFDFNWWMKAIFLLVVVASAVIGAINYGIWGALVGALIGFVICVIAAFILISIALSEGG